jgi:hypothetical protein
MKKFLLSVAMIMSALSSFAGDEPFGYSLSQESLNALTTKIVSAYDNDVLMEEAERNDKMGMMSLYGKLSRMDISSMDAGTWSNLPNGDRVWQLRFKSPNAMGVGVCFNNFYLPEGATISLYNADRTQFDGPYTSEENESHGYFRTGEVFGDEAILEYYEPAGVTSSPRLGILGFGHFFRFIDTPIANRGSSEPCEVDVNCPEGSTFVNQRQSVVRLSLASSQGFGLCTGSIVNNLAYDCRKFVLTAFHCTVDSDAADLLLSSIRFNYQRSGCGTGSASATQQKTGLLPIADSNDNGGATGSDFALLEMEDDIPSGYNVYYAGWNAEAVTPTTGELGWKVVCIHHPSGDVKKISTSNNVVSATWQANNHHWKVRWMETETNWGVTEGGSSGSPIYNNKYQIVGTLTGGGSFCDAPTAEDFYGKMDKHWNGNPNAANQDLQDWLDPNDTNVLSCEGAYPGTGALPCQPPLGVEELLNFNDVSIYPSPASDFIQIKCEKYRDIREVRIYNAAGALVQTLRLTDLTTELNVQNLPVGMYYLTLQHQEGATLTQKLNVIR